MANDNHDHWLIKGETKKGRKFRPSDWIERVSASLAGFDADQRLHYSKEVRPCLIQGEKCLLVSKELSHTNPEAYAFIMRFARENDLHIQEDRRKYPRAS
ncbi:MAG: DUF3579 domain-containing protein [Pseudomonadota bacterium]